MSNTLITPEEMARDVIESIKKHAYAAQKEYGWDNEKRNEFELMCACSLADPTIAPTKPE